MKQLLTIFATCSLIACNNGGKSQAESQTEENASSSTTTAKPKSGGSGCATFFWFKKGAKMEYEIFDGKGTKTHHTTTTIDDVHTEGSTVLADYTTTFGDDRKFKATYRCEGDRIFMNLRSLFDSPALKNSALEIEVKDAYISYPWNMKQGDVLDDATFEIITRQEGKEFMKMSTLIKDRQVESLESVTTAAGTWQCLKLKEIHLNTTTMQGRKVSGKEAKTIQWFSPEVGLVKTESYDEKGVLNGRSELVGVGM